MLPDRVSNPGPLTYESGALPIALRGPADETKTLIKRYVYASMFSVVCLFQTVITNFTFCLLFAV